MTPASIHLLTRYACMPGRHARAFACGLLLLAATLAVHAQSPQWRALASRDGVQLEARAVAGERFDELRASASLAASPQAVADYLFGKYLDERNRNIRRTFLRRTPVLTLWADVLDAPMISERCYSMRFERQVLADGEVRVKFTSHEYAGKETRPGCIALRSRGEWRMVPITGGTRLTYTSLTDIGGDVPMMLVRRSLSSAATSSVRKVVAGASGLPLPRGIGD